MAKKNPREKLENVLEQASAALDTGRAQEAEKQFRAAVDLARELPPDEVGDLLAVSLINLGFALENQQRYEQALIPFVEAFLQRRWLEPEVLFIVEDHLADLMMRLGHYRKAIPFCEDTVRLFAELEPSKLPGLSQKWHRAGMCYLNNGLNEHAIRPLTESLQLVRGYKTADDPEIAAGLLDLGNACRRSAADQAIQHYTEAATIWEKAGDIAQASSAWMNLGVAYSDQGRYEEAMTLLERALDVRKDNTPRYANVLNNMADCRKRMKQYEEARRLITRAIAIVESHGGGPLLGGCLDTLASIAEAEGNLAEAAECYTRTRQLHQQTSSPDFNALKEAFENEARVLEKIGDAVAASHAYDQARLFASAIAAVPEPGRDLCKPPLGDSEREAMPERNEAINLFENDDAWDWLDELESLKGYSSLNDIFREVQRQEYVEHPDSSEALTAAAVVACGIGQELEDTPSRIKDWVAARKNRPSQKLVDAAIAAVSRIRENSETRELYQEQGLLNSWLRPVDTLLALLSGEIPAPDAGVAALALAFTDGAKLRSTSGDEITIRVEAIGELVLPSGNVIACEPFGLPGDLPFIRRVAPGRYPVRLSLACFPDDDVRVACAKLELSQEPVIRWIMALCPGQKPQALEQGEFYGYPVDGGTGCFCDASVNECLHQSDIDLSEDLLPLLAENDKPTWTWSNFVLDHKSGLNVISFSTGFGDGYYSSYFGIGEKGAIVALVTDFDVVN